MTDTTPPWMEYEARLTSRRAELERYNVRYARIAFLRLGVAVLCAGLVWLIFWPGLLTPWWLLLPPIAFFSLMTVHSRTDRQRRQVAQAVSFYERGHARIEDRWIGTGEPGTAFADESHLYAADLDLFGRGSLFELLSTARTKTGEETLAGWLSRPGSRGEVVARQEAVGELRCRLDLREHLASLGPDLRSSIHLEKLTRWANAPLVLENRWLRPAASALSILVVAALVYALTSASPWPYYVCLSLQLVFLLALRKEVGNVLSGVELPQRELELASELISRLEAEEFRSPRLRDLRATFGSDSERVSGKIRHLVRLVERQKSLASADVPLTIVAFVLSGLLVPVSVVFLLKPRTAMAIEDWREEHGQDVESWFLAIGEFETLTALSGYAYEHPTDPFPEVLAAGPVLEADELAHPLLPTSECVPNSVSLNASQQLIVVSGSNMSGKSTLLRTIGVNAVLALAGAPVRAKSCRISPVAIGATLRIQDSLQGGTSRFYAEITRIRDIMALTAGPLPVLFLLDELLHGTNSHDRAVGAEGIVRGLIDRGAIGLATTHDLALARVADALSDRAINVHFQDRMENGRMAFDYRMKPGVIEKSNALALMRSVGLEV